MLDIRLLCPLTKKRRTSPNHLVETTRIRTSPRRISLIKDLEKMREVESKQAKSSTIKSSSERKGPELLGSRSGRAMERLLVSRPFIKLARDFWKAILILLITLHSHLRSITLRNRVIM